MEVGDAASYWCHSCSQMVNPILEVEMVKCPLCQGEFIEEMETAAASTTTGTRDIGASESDRVLSLLAPILLGMMINPHRGHRFRRHGIEDSSDDDNDDNVNNRHRDEVAEFRELESIIRRRRRRRSSATILHRIQDIRAGMLLESENSDSNQRDMEGREHRDGERVILINPFNQTIIVQGSYDSNGNSQNQPIGSMGDYFIGPGLDMFLQHLAENDPNRYGTPPAKKEAVEAMPTVKIESSLQCSVCLDDFQIGSEAKEMPCNHKFHSGCILPWLELHSSCPVCRYQLPSDESKFNSNISGNSTSNNAEEGNGGSSNSNRNSGEDGDGDGDERTDNVRNFSVNLPWPFSSLFSSSGYQSGNRSSTSATSSFSGPSTNTNARSSASSTDEH